MARRQVVLRNGGSLRVDMQLDGRLCGPGSYGHLNGCRYLLLVEKVLECEEEDS